MFIPVLNRDGNPLSPCHPARARKLLRSRKAHIASRYPFVIRLVEQVENPVLPSMIVALDDGKTCGLAVVQEKVKENVALCGAELKTRGERISDNLKDRKALRSARRNHRNHRPGREGKIKINYRHGQEYPPSIRADAEVKVNAIKRLIRLYPITEIMLEPIKLDVQKKLNPKKPAYGNGSETGSLNQRRRESILKRDGYRCLYGGDSVTSETAHIHHFVQRKNGGTKRYDIQGTLCIRCHTSVDTEQLALSFDLDSYPSIRAAGRAMHGRYLLEQKLRELGLPLVIRYGYETKDRRETLGLEKSHIHDAVALGCNLEKPLLDRMTVYEVTANARHGSRKLFDANPGVAAYRKAADRQPHVDPARMKVDEHNREENRRNRSYRRHVRNKYYKKLKMEGRFNHELLPGKSHLHEVYATNRAVLINADSVLVKNQHIKAWKYEGVWPNRWRMFEKRDIVQLQNGEYGVVTSIKSTGLLKVEFVDKRADRKCNYSEYRPERLTIVQKRSGQTWLEK